MQTYRITITGKTPLLLHADNIDWADQMGEWKDAPANKGKSKPGDDRTPAFRWIGCLYHDGDVVAMPSDNIMRCAMEGGALVPVPGGKGGKTFKAQTQSGMQVGEAFWPLDVGGGGPLPMSEISALMTEELFATHRERAAALGFSLFVKRAKIGTQKHVRVRPRFDQWSCSGTINVWDAKITKPILQEILNYAGQYKGLGDWRPGSKTPGAFGMFEARVD